MLFACYNRLDVSLPTPLVIPVVFQWYFPSPIRPQSLAAPALQTAREQGFLAQAGKHHLFPHDTIACCVPI